LSIGQAADNRRACGFNRDHFPLGHRVEPHLHAAGPQRLELMQFKVAPQVQLSQLMIQRRESVQMLHIPLLDLQHAVGGLERCQFQCHFRVCTARCDIAEDLQRALQHPPVVLRRFVGRRPLRIGRHEVHHPRVTNRLHQPLAVATAADQIDFAHGHDHGRASSGRPAAAFPGSWT